MSQYLPPVSIGPGLLYVGPYDAAEPTIDDTTLSPAFRAVGYTKSGSTLNVALTTQSIEVPVLLDPVRHQVVKREVSVTFEMAQTTVNNLALALNGGADVDNTTQTYDAPAPGQDVRVMLVLVTDDPEIWIFRQCVSADGLSMAFGKAPDYRTIPVKFSLEKPTNAEVFRVLFPVYSGDIFSNVFRGVF